MSDLISRQAAISHVDDVPYIKEHPNVGLLWKAWIESLPSAQPEHRWIPCSERLPKRQGYYICTFKDGSKYKRASAVKWSNGWQLTGTRSYWTVLAWMPLPPAYEGE